MGDYPEFIKEWCDHCERSTTFDLIESKYVCIKCGRYIIDADEYFENKWLDQIEHNTGLCKA